MDKNEITLGLEKLKREVEKERQAKDIVTASNSTRTKPLRGNYGSL